jgi:hypothetical protein
MLGTLMNEQLSYSLRRREGRKVQEALVLHVAHCSDLTRRTLICCGSTSRPHRATVADGSINTISFVVSPAVGEVSAAAESRS